MTIAELHGKIKPLEYKEDLLTSDVFGTFKYLGIEYGLRQFLNRAVSMNGERKLKIPPGFRWVKFHFWPTMSDNTEADLLIELLNDKDEKILVMVEAKYFSSKNTREETEEENIEDRENIIDQLDQEFNNLQKLSFKELRITEGLVLKKVLLYVTADYSMPKEEIRESLKLIKKKYKNSEDKLLWLSWREIPTIIKQNRDRWSKCLDVSSFHLIEDLEKLLIRKSLRKFEGFRTLSDLDIWRPLDKIFFRGFNGFNFIRDHDFNFDLENIFWKEK